MRRNPILIHAGVALAAFYTASVGSAMEPSGVGDPKPVQAIRQSTELLNDEGSVLCKVKPGTPMTANARHSNGEDIKVKLDAPGCPKEAYVDSEAVQPAGGKELIVNESNLALRKEPNRHSEFLCGIAGGKSVEVLDNTSTKTSWVKVRVKDAKPGCEEGFMNADYMKSPEEFNELPLDKSTIQPSKDPRAKTEAGVECVKGAECKPKSQEQDFRDIVQNLGDENQYYNAIAQLGKNAKAKPVGLSVSRGLFQIKLCTPGNGYVGPYGSYHYLPHSPKPTGSDAYANPVAGCAFMGALQKWNREKSKICTSGSECRIAWGDISYSKSKRWPGKTHSSHKHGDCIDFRPILKGKFRDQPLTFKSSDYDRDSTAKFVAFMREQGASTVIFNDPKIPASRDGRRRGKKARARMHDNHIHICFNKNPKSQKTCSKIDKTEKMCPAGTK